QNPRMPVLDVDQQFLRIIIRYRLPLELLCCKRVAVDAGPRWCKAHPHNLSPVSPVDFRGDGLEWMAILGQVNSGGANWHPARADQQFRVDYRAKQHPPRGRRPCDFDIILEFRLAYSYCEHRNISRPQVIESR